MYLEIKGVSRQIKQEMVLNQVDLQMEKGKAYLLLGKNGAGKTMLMRAISGLIRLDEGEIWINEKRLWKEISFPESMGILLENPGFVKAYSGYENLMLLASIRKKVGEREVLQALEKVGLKENMHKKYRKYSLGMKQKLGIAAAIFEQPDLILLDEPTNALDEKSVQDCLKILREEKERGALLLISSHNPEEFMDLADEMIYMDAGRIKKKEMKC
ncbi:ABC transporter ATP-binding protein [Suipraeoptans intestinalis]|uniref:ABC transporter ATP-binding protein n=1 Tax=Suipraeoptans intestinalis TaxID=2606628 RepID=UPI0023F16ADF|nr:ABC transporter ATP-binding protein [Suipraeoptans intestinalis]MDD7769507.1 ABC transporter ATP-binding protein [Suipraeoptans intestinalis]MDY3121812.1 ABC transporter ATP-binding protein [Suipraeoptans intestinalis]